MDAPQEPAQRADFDALLDRYTGLIRRGRPFVLLFELGAGAPLSAEYRDELRRHARQHDFELSAMQRGLGIVAKSAYQRATARALLWLIKPPYPVEIFADWPAAYRWAQGRASLLPIAV